ncbi:ribonuclease III [Clostridiaceae bacterium HSG29]|nr:ribonuclease III [Clostridiaceae bacterium HSG29]
MIESFEKVIGYVFNNKELITEALTHSSYANENKSKGVQFNERMEFLGDSVLSLVVSEYIFTKLQKLPEGELTKIRARIVCETSLAMVANEIELGNHIRLGRGEELTGGRKRSSILADGFEAVLAAIYLDSNFEIAKKFILRIMKDKIEEGVNGEILIDYKTRLQEIVQSKTKNKLSYNIYNEEGPDHNKTFFVEVKLKELVLGKGKGSNKKEAEQKAAKEAIKEAKF